MADLRNIQVYSGDPNNPNSMQLVHSQNVPTNQRNLNIDFGNLSNGLASIQNASSQLGGGAPANTASDISAMQSPSITPIRGTQQPPAPVQQNAQLPAVPQKKKGFFQRVGDWFTEKGTKAVDWFKGMYNKGNDALWGTPGKYEQIPLTNDAQSNFLDFILADAYQRLNIPDIASQSMMQEGALGIQDPYHRFPEVQNLTQDALTGLQNPYAGFEPLEKQAVKHYQEEVIPALLEGFHGRTSSPYIQKHLENSAQGLETALNAQRAQYGMQNRGMLLNQAGLGLGQANTNRDLSLRLLQSGLSNQLANRNQNLTQGQLGLTPKFTTQYFPGKSGFIQEVAPVAAKALATAGMAALGI